MQRLRRDMVGSITENQVLHFLLENPLHHAERAVAEVMGEAFPIVKDDMAVSQLSHYFTKETPAVVSRDRSGGLHVVTQYDLIQAI